MACLDENTILAFVESRLAADAVTRVEEHLASCAECRRLLAEFAAMAPPPNLTEPQLATAAEGPEPSEDERADLGRRVARAQAAKRVGTVLSGRWTIERLLGMGGMAQVFEATHRNGRAVAVKLLRPELAVEPVLVERFLREGYVANKVGHEGAVAILDDDVTPEGTPFLVMELLRGRTLRERIDAGGPLPLGDALRITAAVLDVLAAAHDKGIVHRDIKPDNLFETERGDIKVLDFGIARLRERIESKGHTQSGMTMGTIGYMAPEQARGQSEAVEPRSDVWSVGASLYTLLTGCVVHEAATPNEALLLAMTASVPSVLTRIPSLPREVASLLDTAMAFDKGARFASARAMWGAVEEARTLVGAGGEASQRVPPTTATLVGVQPTGTLLGVSASAPVLKGALSAPNVAEATPSPPSRPESAPRSRLPLLVLAGTAAVALGVAAMSVRGGASSSAVAPASSSKQVVVATAPAPTAAPEAPATASTASYDASLEPQAPPTAARPAPVAPMPTPTPPSRSTRANDRGPSSRPATSPRPDPLGPRR